MNGSSNQTSDGVPRLPLAELHIHLEGAVPWETIRQLHPEGHGLPIHPPWLAKARGMDFATFERIFDVFVRPAMATSAAVEQATIDTLSSLVIQGVRYVELSVAVRFYRSPGCGLIEALKAVGRARRWAQEQSDIVVRFVAGFNRQEKLPNAMRQLRAIEDLIDGGGRIIDAIDLHGDETLNDGSHLAPLFRAADRCALRTKAHAGEHGDAANVRTALRHLGVRHICHGVRAIGSAEVMALVREYGAYLHVCPTANRLLRVRGTEPDALLPLLLNSGCQFTLNSDDPMIFGCSVRSEYASAVRNPRVGIAGVGAVARTAFRAALVEDCWRRKVLEDLETILSR